MPTQDTKNRHALPPARTERPEPPRRRAWPTLIAMSLGFGVVQLDVTIVNVALDSMAAALGGRVQTLQWIVDAYTVAFAALILAGGALGDRIGAKRIFLAGFALFSLASLGCALASALPELIAARCVQGIGAALLVPSSLALLNHAYADGQARARAVAIWAAGASLALTAGPLMGGVLIAASGWRSIFLVNIPIGALGLALAFFHARETPRRRSRSLDLPGQLCVTAALALLSAALIEGGALGWTDARIIAGLALASACMGAFVAIERRAATPMLPLSLFADRSFAATATAGLLLNASFYGLIFVLSLYFQRLRHVSALGTGVLFAPMTGAVFVANLVTPRLARRCGAKGVIVAGALMMTVGTGSLSFTTAGASGVLLTCMAMALAGCGLGLLVPPLTSTLLGSVDKSRSGIASGVLNAMRQSGSVLGVALLGSLLTAPGGFARGFLLALLLAGAFAMAGGVAIAVWLPGREDAGP